MGRSSQVQPVADTTRLPWWYFIAGVGGFFVLWTLLTPVLPDAEWLGVPKQSFNLGLELNLGVWWSSMLLASAMLWALVLSRKVGEDRLGWTGVAVALGVLTIDEMSSFHERSDETWLLPLAGVALVLFALALLRIARSGRTLPAVLIGSAFVLFALAFKVLEDFNSGDADGLRKGLTSALEEGAEILGITLVLVALSLTLGIPRDASVRAVLPPVEDPVIRRIALVLLGAGVVAALVYVPSDGRGDPGRWAGAFGFLLVACLIDRDRPRRSPRLASAALVALAASVFACYHLYDVPGAERVLPDFGRHWGGALLAVALWFLARDRLRSRVCSVLALGLPVLEIIWSPLTDAHRLQHTLVALTAATWVIGLPPRNLHARLGRREEPVLPAEPRA